MKFQLHLKIWGIGSLLLLGLVGIAQGDMTSLAIGNTNPVLDHLGRSFPGTWAGGSNDAARVEVREVGAGIVAPDPVTGEGNDTANPLFLVTHMGNEIISGSDTGMFSYTLPGRLGVGVEYFARAYDAQLPSEAYYYVNSLSFQDVPPDEYETTPTLNVEFQTLYLVNQGDDTDTDGDLLPDWMELDITSTDPTAWDTDEDGYFDGFEVIHDGYLENGVVNLNEIQLYLPDFSEPPSETNEYYVRWWSIPGVGYRLEYRDTMMNGQSFSNIWAGTASETNLEVSVEWVQTNAGVKGFFRYLIP